MSSRIQVNGFDQAVRAAIDDLVRDGSIDVEGDQLRLSVTAKIVWGVPG